MNKYRVLLPLLVNGEHGQGDEFDHEFTADEEATNLASGLLEIVPREYRVVSDSTVYDTKPGGTFKRALSIGEEQHLFAAGHIERVEPARNSTKPRKKVST